MTPASTTPNVVPAARLRGRLTLPADKSIAHRALIFGALSGGPTTVTMRAPGRDVLSTLACLRALGVAITDDGDGRHAISGRPSRDAELDCGNSGTTMRLLAGVVAGLPLSATLDGDDSLRARPMERVATLLRAAGAEVTTTDGHAPLTVVGRATARPDHPSPAGRQRAAAGRRGPGRPECQGRDRRSTRRVRRAITPSGCWPSWASRSTETVRLTTVTGPAKPSPFELEVPGDPSAASAWLVAAALHPDAELTMVDVGLNPTRLALVGLLQRMGVDIETRVTGVSGSEPVGEMSVRGGRPLRSVSIGGGEVADLIDELPLIAIAMASVDDASEVRDASELRVKETDRIAAMVTGLRAIGAEVEELAGRLAGSARDAARGEHRDPRRPSDRDRLRDCRTDRHRIGGRARRRRLRIGLVPDLLAGHCAGVPACSAMPP